MSQAPPGAPSSRRASPAWWLLQGPLRSGQWAQGLWEPWLGGGELELRTHSCGEQALRDPKQSQFNVSHP